MPRERTPPCPEHPAPCGPRGTPAHSPPHPPSEHHGKRLAPLPPPKPHSYSILLRMSSSFLSTSPGVRSSSSAMRRCSSGASSANCSQRSPSMTSFTGAYAERKAMWSRPHSGGCSCRRCISRWLKKSTSSRLVKGSIAPIAPITLPCISTSTPPGCITAFCSDVMVSPTWNWMMLLSLFGAPFMTPVTPTSLPPVGSSSTWEDTSAGSRVTYRFPNLSAPATVS
mmetsp:Transcript_23698/g.60848  ORF Transcript_23698/g.60848 Transcript_23698/m.60848 type:complete len:225 (-) Transcript_23698:28-702(-)